MTLTGVGACTLFGVVGGPLIASVGFELFIDGARIGSLTGDVIGSSLEKTALALEVGEIVSFATSNEFSPLSEISFQTFRTSGWFIKSDEILSTAASFLNMFDVATA